MPTWALFDSQWDWKGFLRDMFAQLEQRQVTHLIVDLRGNEGGMDAGLRPEVLVKPRIEDIARGVDTELEAAKALGHGSPEPLTGSGAARP